MKSALFIILLHVATSARADEFDLIEGANRFLSYTNTAKSMDNTLIKQLNAVNATHDATTTASNEVGDLQKKLQDLENNPPQPPEPPPLPPPQQDQGAGSGSGSGSGSGGGGKGGGLQAPQMASIPAASTFTPPAGPQEITPDLSGANFGDDEGGRGFTPGESNIQPFTPPKLDLSSPRSPNTAPRFGPAQVAATGMPKLKTLESMPSPGASAEGAGAAAGAAGGGGAGGSLGGAAGGAGGGGGTDGSSLNGVGIEPGYDSASGIASRDAGWGSSSGDEGGSGSGGGSGSDSGDTKIASQLFNRAPSSTTGTKAGRTKGDGSPDDTIFGKLAMWIDESCELDAGIKSNGVKPGVCDAASANEALAYADVEDKPTFTGNAEKALKEVPKEKPAAPKKLRSGLREIASEDEAEVTEVDPDTKTDSKPAEPEEDLLGALRAGATL